MLAFIPTNLPYWSAHCCKSIGKTDRLHLYCIVPKSQSSSCLFYDNIMFLSVSQFQYLLPCYASIPVMMVALLLAMLILSLSDRRSWSHLEIILWSCNEIWISTCWPLTLVCPRSWCRAVRGDSRSRPSIRSTQQNSATPNSTDIAERANSTDSP